MPDTKEIIVCFKNVSEAILAEEALTKARFSVRVMPRPASFGPGCGICLRLLPEESSRALYALAEQGIAAAEISERKEPDRAAAY
jgi:hypothetical protein